MPRRAPVLADGVPRHRVALLPGSIRRESIHRRLARALAASLAARDVEVDLIDLADLPMAIYHGDDEAEHGPPAAAVALRDRLASCDGLIFVSPEHNGGPTALLKNSIDWVTRVDRTVFKPLLIGLAAASPGGRGGVNGLLAMRHLAEHMRLELAPEQLSIATAGEAFVDGGDELVRADDVARLDGFVSAYVARLDERTT